MRDIHDDARVMRQVDAMQAREDRAAEDARWGGPETDWLAVAADLCLPAVRAAADEGRDDQ
jgi:hypothetical protein